MLLCFLECNSINGGTLNTAWSQLHVESIFKTAKLRETESRMVVARDWWFREMR